MKRLNGLQLVIVTGFGLGCLPVAPGTYASALAAAMGWLLCYFPGPIFPAAVSSAILCSAALLCSVWLAPAAEEHFGTSDPGRHVIDEIAGQFFTLSLVFAFIPERCVSATVLSFAMFRLFDIAKPFPIRRIEHLAGGWGVSFDDMAAGLYAAVCVLVLLGFPPFVQ